MEGDESNPFKCNSSPRAGHLDTQDRLVRSTNHHSQFPLKLESF